jgi:hypothetical protein
MQIFLSHSSRQKPLVREIKNGLPEHLGSWLDEEKLLFGDSIPQSIESVIKSDTDYVLMFIAQAFFTNRDCLDLTGARAGADLL